MRKTERFGYMLFLLLYSVALYYIFKLSALLAVLVNSLILLILGYVSVLYSETVLDVLEEIKENGRRKYKLKNM